MSELPKIAMHDMGDHLIVRLPSPGRCDACLVMHSFFVNRGGRTHCVGCDQDELDRQALLARVTLDEILSPIIVRCRCPVSKDPSDLFKCMCPAGDPENRT